MLNKDKIVGRVLAGYINFVVKTSKIEYIGKEEILNGDENYLAVFWHGNSYALLPLVQEFDLGVITTINQRGSYISEMCIGYGYEPLRVPDETRPGNILFQLVRKVNKDNSYHVALATDGPLGPYHQPKEFTFVLAEMTNRRVLPLSIEVKRKITLWKRWDKYVVPLPFCKMTVKFSEPVTVSKEDRLEEYKTVKENLTEILERKISK